MKKHMNRNSFKQFSAFNKINWKITSFETKKDSINII